jgi:hypothetical protein
MGLFDHRLKRLQLLLAVLDHRLELLGDVLG